jgi:hypothetical protein
LSNPRNFKQNEERPIDSGFNLAVEAMKIPPAPKSMVAPKFAFGCVSDSDEEQQDTPEV